MSVAAIIEAVRKATHTEAGGPFVSLHEPRFVGNEWNYVKECLDTGWVSSVGKFVDRFEADLAAYTGARHCVVTVNGTAALHLALLVAGVCPDDEVIVPTLSFIATSNAVSHCGAIPHYVDSAADTLGLDPEKLSDWLDLVAERRAGGDVVNRRTGRRIAAVVPMHCFGHPVDLDGLLQLCAKWGLTLVEDAAESLGSTYRGRHCGTFGRCSALSFNGNKVITTGGGGAILTDDAELAARAKHLSTTAKVPHRWRFDHDAIAFNYRLPNLNAALGCAQLELLPGFLERKRSLAAAYQSLFADIPSVRFVVEPEGSRSNYWLNAILVEPEMRDALLEAANGQGLMMRPAWTLAHHLPIYADRPRMDDLSAAEDIERRLVNLPSSAILGGTA